MDPKKRRRYFCHPIYPYLFSLSIFTFFLLASTFILIFGLTYNWVFVEILPAYLFILAIYAIYLVVCIKDSFLFFGFFCLKPDEIVFYAPFRRKICMPYKTVCEIGIDYGVFSQRKQFWIYICKESFPQKYVHKIHTLPMEKKYMRVKYSDQILKELLQVLPVRLEKQLSKSQTALRF